MHFPGKQIVENSSCINATLYMLPVEYPSIYSERIYLNFKSWSCRILIFMQQLRSGFMRYKIKYKVMLISNPNCILSILSHFVGCIANIPLGSIPTVYSWKSCDFETLATMYVLATFLHMNITKVVDPIKNMLIFQKRRYGC